MPRRNGHASRIGNRFYNVLASIGDACEGKKLFFILITFETDHSKTERSVLLLYCN